MWYSGLRKFFFEVDDNVLGSIFTECVGIRYSQIFSRISVQELILFTGKAG